MLSLCYYVTGAKKWGKATSSRNCFLEKSGTDVTGDQQVIALIPSY